MATVSAVCTQADLKANPETRMMTTYARSKYAQAPQTIVERNTQPKFEPSWIQGPMLVLLVHPR
jgi:hypothetical protein